MKTHSETPWALNEASLLVRDAIGNRIADFNASTGKSWEEKQANAELFLKAPALAKVAEHILAMADDAYLTGHPEWAVIAEEARQALI